MIWYICTNSYGDILLLKVAFCSEVVTSGVVATSVLIFVECQRHTSSIWPWLGAPKVRLYDTFLGSLHQEMTIFLTILKFQNCIGTR